MEINIPLLMCSDSSACIRKASHLPKLLCHGTVWHLLPILWSSREAGSLHSSAGRKTRGCEGREAPGPPARRGPALSQRWLWDTGSPQGGEQQPGGPRVWLVPIAELHTLKELWGNNNPRCPHSPRAQDPGVGKAITHNELPLLQSVYYYVPLRLPSVSRDFLSRLETL